MYSSVYMYSTMSSKASTVCQISVTPLFIEEKLKILDCCNFNAVILRWLVLLQEVPSQTRDNNINYILACLWHFRDCNDNLRSTGQGISMSDSFRLFFRCGYLPGGRVNKFYLPGC